MDLQPAETSWEGVRLAVVSDERRFVWVQTPKVASTTLHTVIEGWRARVEGRPPAPTPTRAVSRRKAGSDWLVGEVLTDAQLPSFVERRRDYFFFCFVRNPYARLLSAYQNKLNRYAKAHRRTLYYASKAYQGFSGWPDREAYRRGLSYLQRRIGFGDLISGLAEAGVGFDDHFARQAQVLRPDLVPYAYVGKLESLQEDLAAIEERLGIPAAAGGDGPHGSRRLNATGAGARYETRYTDDLRSAVHELYRPDFEAFGYAA